MSVELEPSKKSSATKRNKDGSVKTKGRSSRFLQRETDLLCSLVVASNLLNTNDANGPSQLAKYKYGRLTGWNDITVAFNASPGISHRPVSVLKDRIHNVRTDLRKLAAFASTLSSSSNANDDHLSVTKPPKISFVLSDAVQAYAAKVQIDLSACLHLASSSISNATARTSSSAPPSPTSSIKELEFVTLPQSFPTPTTTTTTTTRHQHTQKRPDNNFSHSSAVVRDNYYEQKLALINGEVSQRAEWHSICMAIKREELAIKKKQVLFWDEALSALQSNTKTIEDVSNIANSMQIIDECPAGVKYEVLTNTYPNENID